MTALTTCLRRLEDKLSLEDQAAMRELTASLQSDGLHHSEAARQAVEHLLGEARQEREELIRRIRAAGGSV